MPRKIKVVKVNRVKKKRYLYTDNDKLEMLQLYHRDGMKQSEIARKFGTTRQYVNMTLKALEKNIEVQGDAMSFVPDEILRRKKLDTLQRIALINSDAIEVVELTIALAKHKIQNTLRAIQDADQLKPENSAGNAFIELDKLTKLLNTALPYVIPKSEANKSEGLNKKPVTKLHKLMSNTIKRETA